MYQACCTNLRRRSSVPQSNDLIRPPPNVITGMVSTTFTWAWLADLKKGTETNQTAEHPLWVLNGLAFVGAFLLALESRPQKNGSMMKCVRIPIIGKAVLLKHYFPKVRVCKLQVNTDLNFMYALSVRRYFWKGIRDTLPCTMLNLQKTTEGLTPTLLTCLPHAHNHIVHGSIRQSIITGFV